MTASGALAALGAIVLFAILTTKTGLQDTLLLNGLKYRVTRYPDRVELFRDDGLRFTYSLRTGKTKLHAGTPEQMEDALRQLNKLFTGQLAAAAADAGGAP